MMLDRLRTEEANNNNNNIPIANDDESSNKVGNEMVSHGHTGEVVSLKVRVIYNLSQML